jgi:hypothetical protein
MPDAAKSALDVAERYANGLATEEELAQARAAAYEPATDADASNAVAEAALAAAYAYVYAAVRFAADRSATRKTAKSEMKAKQTQILRKFLEGTV